MGPFPGLTRRLGLCIFPCWVGRTGTPNEKRWSVLRKAHPSGLSPVARRQPMFVFEFEATLFKFKLNKPAFEPLLQLPP